MTEAGAATDALLAFATKTTVADLPAPMRAWAAQAVMDTIGVAIGGRDAAGIVEARGLVRAWGGKPEATLWGSRDRVPSPHAVLVNASASRALDFDDVFDAIPFHPSAYLVPAAVAAGELAGGGSGADLVAAVAVGAEVMIRLALGRGPTDPDAARVPLSRVLGPTVAAARMLGLDVARTRHALGLAFCLSAGELQSYEDGALSIRLQQGFVAEAALRAVCLAAAGITGPWNFLEGRRGLARADGIADASAVVDGLGEVFHAVETDMKPYPCCRCSHPAIAAALRLRAAHSLAVEAIAAVRVTVAPKTAAIVVEPRAVRFAPATVPVAQFSLPYAVAAALATGEVGLAAFSAEGLRDPVTRGLIGRMQVDVDEALGTRAAGMIAPARVEVALASGVRVGVEATPETCREDLAGGGAERKFRSCMAAGGRGSVTERALGVLAHLEDRADAVSSLVSIMAGEGSC
ncbi:MAG: MmgE/PrpD family protein [Candidatus Rokubacteria bacterium]|nr:MmgE/PrpD family protein [Candidatus Rokubacteria bacterium]